MSTRMPRPRLIDWTGERCVPWADDPQVIYEHLHRYLLAAELADGKEVIDLGSGEGYGSALLAERAKSVLGVELDPTAVEHAKANYPLETVTFRCGSVLDLDDIPERSFDLVVCFEMIEHIAEHDQLVATAARILRPEGVFLVSTPDRRFYTEAHDYHNPYHVKELSLDEFDGLLSAHFGHLAMWTQSALVRSVLAPTDSNSRAGDVQQVAVARVDDRWDVSQPPDPPYLLAAASASPLPSLPGVSILSRAMAPADEYGEAGELHQLHELWGIERLRRQVAIYETALAEETDARRRSELELEELARQHGAAADELREIKGSRAWAALSRYRRLRARLSAARKGG